VAGGIEHLAKRERLLEVSSAIDLLLRAHQAAVAAVSSELRLPLDFAAGSPNV
jgi:hypothetical protein